MIAMTYDNTNQVSDLVRTTGNLQVDETFSTSVYVSLFTRRKALPDDEIPDPKGHREGWWADTYAEVAGDNIGSRLWLLSRESGTPDVLSSAKAYAREALQWMIDDGIAKTIEVEVERQGKDALVFQVKIERPTGQATKWESRWVAHMEAL